MAAGTARLVRLRATVRHVVRQEQNGNIKYRLLQRAAADRPIQMLRLNPTARMARIPKKWRLVSTSGEPVARLLRYPVRVCSTQLHPTGHARRR